MTGLDEEWLLALLVSLPDVVQLNLTTCGTCQNGHIVAGLKRSLEHIEVHTGIDTSQKLRLVGDQSELVYEARRFDRRRFFRVFGTKVIRDIQRGGSYLSLCAIAILNDLCMPVGVHLEGGLQLRGDGRHLQGGAHLTLQLI